MFAFPCQNTQEHILKHLLDRVPLPMEAVHHLEGCPECQRHHQDMQNLIMVLLFTTPHPAPPTLKAHLMLRLNQHR